MSTNTPCYFIDENNTKLENMKEVVNRFNSFLVNAGPYVAKSIKMNNNCQKTG